MRNEKRKPPETTGGNRAKAGDKVNAQTVAQPAMSEKPSDFEISGTLPLTPADFDNLARSYIPLELADRARLCRVDSPTGAEFVGGRSKHGESYAGILFPYVWPGDNRPHEYRLRRDKPTLERQTDGSVKETGKYLSPPGRSGLVYIPPGTPPDFLSDPEIPVYITEGEKKALALFRFFEERETPALVVGLPGVWNWRGKVGKTTDAEGQKRNVTGTVDRLLSIVWKGRTVKIVFDTNTYTNNSVQAARKRLSAELRERGAWVTCVDLPETEGVNGIDDLLFLKGTDFVADLFDKAGQPSDQAGLDYREAKDGLVWLKPGPDGKTTKPLCNFTARIVRQILEDDGETVSLLFDLSASRSGYTRRFSVRAGEFASLKWADEQLGAEAVVYPGQSVKEHIGVAVKLLSGEIPRHTVYKHLGWRKVDGRWVYLHAAGGIGADDVSVDPSGLQAYELPKPPDVETARNAVRHSLKFLDIAARSQTWPVLAAVYSAPLSDIIAADFVVWLQGGTGARKSTTAALALSHFGDFLRHNLPANFDSTANSLLKTTFTAKDALLVIDDFAPSPDAKTAVKQEAAAHALIRAVGDRRGRGRLTRDIRQRSEEYPRGLVLVTSELPPPGSQSTAARCFEIPWKAASVDLDVLTDVQQIHRKHFTEAMAAFIGWLAPQYDTLKNTLPPWLRETAGRFAGDHGRIPETCAKLTAGVVLFLEFAESVGAVDSNQRQALIEQATAALAECAQGTNLGQLERRPTTMFFEILETMFAQGKAYLEKRTGEHPDEPEKWGYKRVQGRADEFRTQPNADLVGYVSEEEGRIYLLPTAVTNAVTRYSTAGGNHFPLGRKALGEYLERDGYLSVKSSDRNTYPVWIKNATVRAWVILTEYKKGVPDNLTARMVRTERFSVTLSSISLSSLALSQSSNPQTAETASRPEASIAVPKTEFGNDLAFPKGRLASGNELKTNGLDTNLAELAAFSPPHGGPEFSNERQGSESVSANGAGKVNELSKDAPKPGRRRARI